MKYTRLWQDSGSPLIRGRVGRRRPFWRPALVAWSIAAVATLLLMSLWLGWAISLPSSSFAVLGAGTGSLLGARLVRRMDSPTSSWFVGVALGILCGLAAVALAGYATGSA